MRTATTLTEHDIKNAIADAVAKKTGKTVTSTHVTLSKAVHNGTGQWSAEVVHA